MLSLPKLRAPGHRSKTSRWLKEERATRNLKKLWLNRDHVMSRLKLSKYITTLLDNWSTASTAPHNDTATEVSYELF